MLCSMACFAAFTRFSLIRPTANDTGKGSPSKVQPMPEAQPTHGASPRPSASPRGGAQIDSVPSYVSSNLMGNCSPRDAAAASPRGDAQHSPRPSQRSIAGASNSPAPSPRGLRDSGMAPRSPRGTNEQARRSPSKNSARGDEQPRDEHPRGGFHAPVAEFSTGLAQIFHVPVRSAADPHRVSGSALTVPGIHGIGNMAAPQTSPSNSPRGIKHGNDQNPENDPWKSPRRASEGKSPRGDNPAASPRPSPR